MTAFFFFFKWQDNLNSIVKSFFVICTRNSSFKLTLSKCLINRNHTFSQSYQTLNCDFQNRDSKMLSLKSLFLKILFFKQLSQMGPKKYTKEAWSKPMTLEHRIAPRVTPLFHDMVQKYGKILHY